MEECKDSFMGLVMAWDWISMKPPRLGSAARMFYVAVTWSRLNLVCTTRGWVEFASKTWSSSPRPGVGISCNFPSFLKFSLTTIYTAVPQGGRPSACKVLGSPWFHPHSTKGKHGYWWKHLLH